MNIAKIVREAREQTRLTALDFATGIFDEFVELVDKPSSVVDNHSSRRQITLPLKQPTRTLDGPSIEFLFGLATSGVYLAARCYQRHGVLLPHPFTLTVFTAVCSLLHWSSAHAARTLSGTLPFVARTFLSFTFLQVKSDFFS